MGQGALTACQMTAIPAPKGIGEGMLEGRSRSAARTFMRPVSPKRSTVEDLWEALAQCCYWKLATLDAHESSPKVRKQEDVDKGLPHVSRLLLRPKVAEVSTDALDVPGSLSTSIVYHSLEIVLSNRSCEQSTFTSSPARKGISAEYHRPKVTLVNNSFMLQVWPRSLSDSFLRALSELTDGALGLSCSDSSVCSAQGAQAADPTGPGSQVGSSKRGHRCRGASKSSLLKSAGRACEFYLAGAFDGESIDERLELQVRWLKDLVWSSAAFCFTASGEASPTSPKSPQQWGQRSPRGLGEDDCTLSAVTEPVPAGKQLVQTQGRDQKDVRGGASAEEALLLVAMVAQDQGQLISDIQAVPTRPVESEFSNLTNPLAGTDDGDLWPGPLKAAELPGPRRRVLL